MSNIHDHIMEQAYLCKMAEENEEKKRGRMGKAYDWAKKNPGKTAAGTAAAIATGIGAAKYAKKLRIPTAGSNKPSNPDFKMQSVQDFLKKGSQTIHDHIMEQAYLCKMAEEEKKKESLLARTAKKAGKAAHWARQNPGKTAAGTAAALATGIGAYKGGKAAMTGIKQVLSDRKTNKWAKSVPQVRAGSQSLHNLQSSPAGGAWRKTVG